MVVSRQIEPTTIPVVGRRSGGEDSFFVFLLVASKLVVVLPEWGKCYLSTPLRSPIPPPVPNSPPTPSDVRSADQAQPSARPDPPPCPPSCRSCWGNSFSVVDAQGKVGISCKVRADCESRTERQYGRPGRPCWAGSLGRGSTGSRTAACVVATKTAAVLMVSLVETLTRPRIVVL